MNNDVLACCNLSSNLCRGQNYFLLLVVSLKNPPSSICLQGVARRLRMVVNMTCRYSHDWRAKGISLQYTVESMCSMKVIKVCDCPLTNHSKTVSILLCRCWCRTSKHRNTHLFSQTGWTWENHEILQVKLNLFVELIHIKFAEVKPISAPIHFEWGADIGFTSAFRSIYIYYIP